jgi:uncharacterized protein with HEPN domain
MHKGRNAKTFVTNDQVVLAVMYALVIISEATAKPGDAAPDLRPDIPWWEIRGIGNRVRYEFNTVGLARVWPVVEHGEQVVRVTQDDIRAMRNEGP